MDIIITRECHKTAWHDLHESVVRKGTEKQMFPMPTNIPQIVMLEVTEGIEIQKYFYRFFAEIEPFGWECKDENITLP